MRHPVARTSDRDPERFYKLACPVCDHPITLRKKSPSDIRPYTKSAYWSKVCPSCKLRVMGPSLDR